MKNYDCGNKNCEYRYIKYEENDNGYVEYSCSHKEKYGFCNNEKGELEMKEEIKNEGFALGFTINEEQLTNRLYCSLEKTIQERIETVIVDKTLKILAPKIEGMFRNVESTTNTLINKSISDFIDNIYSNTSIVVPSGNSWETKTKDIILKEYVMEQLKLKVESGRFKIDYNEYTIAEYIRKLINSDVDNTVKSGIKEQIKQVTDMVNLNIKNSFEQSTKEMLSKQVYDILMANETYAKIENGIKLLSSK
jgi:hypothetical protein